MSIIITIIIVLVVPLKTFFSTRRKCTKLHNGKKFGWAKSCNLHCNAVYAINYCDDRFYSENTEIITVIMSSSSNNE